ncbi:MAG: PP2C family serine/threonine-protein phosphatase [Pseudomonadota bacterium]|nr:PP2C family serine/threonine-protein phosphatase [Pseudomonadota bacterium]
MLVFDICGATHQGRVRQHNEDHMLVGRFVKNSGQLALSFSSDDDFAASYGVLLCVADGIGGVAGGEMASRLTLVTLEKVFYAAMKPDAEAIVPLLRQAADRANSSVRGVAANKREYADMGSTLSGVCLMGERYWVFNAGDSRVYRYRNGVLKPLSNDDTLAARAVRRGAMTFEQAAHSPDAHILTNYVGAAEFSLAVDAGPGLRDGDGLLICSDGLYDMVDDDTLAGQLQQFNASGVSCAEQAARLLALANERGGRDNISLILMRVRHEPG